VMMRRSKNGNPLRVDVLSMCEVTGSTSGCFLLSDFLPFQKRFQSASLELPRETPSIRLGVPQPEFLATALYTFSLYIAHIRLISEIRVLYTIVEAYIATPTRLLACLRNGQNAPGVSEERTNELHLYTTPNCLLIEGVPVSSLDDSL
jgi:hypothetical protein